jgi:hypothetical protein
VDDVGAPDAVREVLRIPERGQRVPRQEVRRSPRVTVKLPFSYQVVENKIRLQGRQRVERRLERVMDLYFDA